MRKLFIIFLVVSLSLVGWFFLRPQINAFPHSDNFDGKRFQNLNRSLQVHINFLKILWWRAGSSAVRWPKEMVQDLKKPDIASPVSDTAVKVTLINHASLLLQWKDVNVLTDPVFSEKLGPWDFLDYRRYRAPGIPIDELPTIQFVFISHNHYDHFDLPTIEKIEMFHHPVYILPLGVGRYLPNVPAERIFELDWWQTYQDSKSGLEVSLVPCQHLSGRSFADFNKTLWGSAVFVKGGKKLYFGGDTGYGDHFKLTAGKFGPMDISLIPIGAYSPRQMFKPRHLDPDDAVQTHLDLQSKMSVAIHFGTFKLSDEDIEDPVIELRQSLKQRNVSESVFKIPKNGETFIF